jgi:beta-glucanase (GH16 family)
LWEVRARFPGAAGTKPCILLWPGTERDVAGKATWPYQIEYDLVETNSERNGGFCNVHYGTTNTQTGPHNFAGDLTQWHIYGCELNSDGMVLCLDGNVIKKLTGDHVRSMYMPHSRSSYRLRDRTSKRLTQSKPLDDAISPRRLRGWLPPSGDVVSPSVP